jgi:hypothetical protein
MAVLSQPSARRAPNISYAKPLLFNSAEALEISLDEVLDHPYYTWPRSLLSYELQLHPAELEYNLQLIDVSTGKDIVFQLTDTERDLSGKIIKCRLNFFSDLPTGEKRIYRLISNLYPSNGVQVEKQYETICQERELTWIADNGTLQIEVPKSYNFAEGSRIPGPIARIGREKHWFGNTIIRTTLPVQLKSELLEDGPLMSQFKLTYCFGKGKTYEAVIRAVKDMDFVELDEVMHGLAEADQVKVITDWDQFNPTHRYAPNRPYGGVDESKHGFASYPFETIDRMVTDSHIELSIHYSAKGELPFRLLPYDPWKALTRLDVATFWNQITMQCIGIFVRKPDQWHDGKYALWASDDRLAIRYFYKDNGFRWEAALVEGNRLYALCCYDHSKNIAEVNRLDRIWHEAVKADNPRLGEAGPASYTLWLYIWHGLLNLDKLKDWQLTYPKTASYPKGMFSKGKLQSPEELVEYLRTNELVVGLPLYGPREDNGFSPVPSREIYNDWVDAYDRLREEMNAEQYRKITGMYLLMGYLHATEDYMPLKTMLGGHPNFLADVKGVPALMATLFPEHPAVKEWVDVFEKSVNLNMRYHLRPDQPEEGSIGGRWTENIACYVWAFLKPIIRPAYLLKYHYDGKNRLLNEYMPKLVNWLLNSLTSPFEGEAKDKIAPGKNGGSGYTEGERRIFLPQGAHARRMIPPKYFYFLGQELRRYEPLLAEAVMAVTRLSDADIELKQEPAWYCMDQQYTVNNGTAADLKSSKYTGYGVVLRSNVNQPDESFVMLQQIDEGPNYRWGSSAQGGCGVVYYYTAGKGYNHNGVEDVGDARLGDVELATNFGVFKHGTFQSIGRNSLNHPLVDLEAVSFAEIEPDHGQFGVEGYSWPEYRSRSVMMVGSDYIVLYDAVFNPSIFRRFSWFVHKDDEYPFMHKLYGDVQKRTEILTEETKGFWLDGAGDLMMLITSHAEYQPEPTDYGYTLSTSQWTDYGFRKQKSYSWSSEEMEFEGRVGWIRKGQGKLMLALIDGKKLRAGLLEIAVDQPEAAVQISMRDNEEIEGLYTSASIARVSITIYDASWLEQAQKSKLYVDGEAVSFKWEGGTLSLIMPAGTHRLELSMQATPEQPIVMYAIQQPQAASVRWRSATAAQSYELERSKDVGLTWFVQGNTKECELLLPYDGCLKEHVRATAFNGTKKSVPSAMFPVYFTDEVPLPPEGLRLHISEEDQRISLAWGQVLGIKLYRLYVRVRGEVDYCSIYEGPNAVYDYIREKGNASDILEFAVTAVSGIGESSLSYPADTDPESLLNWEPIVGESYRKYNQYQHIHKFN